MKLAFLAVFALVPVLAHAQTASTVVALTPDQLEAAKEAAARANANRPATAIDTRPSLVDRRVHGEVGVAIGTGGYSSIYGTAVAPLGDSGWIALSLANEQGGGYYYGRGPLGRGFRH